MLDFYIDGPLLLRHVPRGRSYSSVVFDPSTSLIVAASSLQARFASFDEDGNRLWEPDGEFEMFVLQPKLILLPSAPNISDPTCDCSTLELIAPDSWMTMDGYVPSASFLDTTP